MLDATKARSELQSLESRRIGLIAKLARLRAEQSGDKEITFPDKFAEGGENAENAIRAENIFFRKRLAQKLSKIDIQQNH